jgi:hypothetical protein
MKYLAYTLTAIEGVEVPGPVGTLRLEIYTRDGTRWQTD